MKRPTRGFTVIEILIVITVIGIIASIALVSWFGLMNRANDKARETDARQWASTFELFRSRFGGYPVMPTSSLVPAWACLGSFSATNNKCGQYTSSVPNQYYPDSSSPNVSALGKTPVNGGVQLNNLLVGPLVYVTQNQDVSPITVTANFLFYSINACPSDFTDVSNPVTYPAYSALLPASSSVHLCDLQKQFTYSPS